MDSLSQTWVAVRDKCNADITAAQNVIEAEGCEQRTADVQRGIIMHAKGILAMAAPKPPVATAGSY